MSLRILLWPAAVFASFLFPTLLHATMETPVVADASGHPYERAIRLYEALPDQDREALSSGAVGPDHARLEEATRAIRAELAAGRLLPAPAWGVGKSTPTGHPVGVGVLRKLVDIGLLSDPARHPAIDHASTFALARTLDQDPGLISCLTAVALRGKVLAEAIGSADALDPDDALRLSEHIAATPRGLPFAERIRHQRVESVTEPRARLHRLLAEKTGRPPPDWLTDLRVSSAGYESADILFVGFEDLRSGKNFTVRSGAPAEGLEVLAVDPAARTATLRRGDDLATLRVESRVLEAAGRLLSVEEIETVIPFWFDDDPPPEMRSPRRLAALLDLFSTVLDEFAAYHDALGDARTAPPDLAAAHQEWLKQLPSEGRILADTIQVMEKVRQTELKSLATRELALTLLRVRASGRSLRDPATHALLRTEHGLLIEQSEHDGLVAKPADWAGERHPSLALIPAP